MVFDDFYLICTIVGKSASSDTGAATTPSAIVGANGLSVPFDDHVTFVHFSKLL